MGSNFNMGQELYVGMQFDTKSAVKNALQQYVMKVHQSFKVVESKSQKYVVCCENRSDDIPCPFYMRAILPKKTDTWKVMQWGGPHSCLNMSITPDHDKLDSNLIATCVLGMIINFHSYLSFFCVCWCTIIFRTYFYRDDQRRSVTHDFFNSREDQWNV